MSRVPTQPKSIAHRGAVPRCPLGRLINAASSRRLPRASAALLLGLLAATVAAQPADPPLFAVQAALDRSGFSPGVIDGVAGRKTEIALRAFQRYHKLPITGRPDTETLAQLGASAAAATVEYTVLAADLRDVTGPTPEDWNQRAAAARLGYESLEALLAERGHCSPALLRSLNPGVSLKDLPAGARVRIPNLRAARNLAPVARLEIDLEERLIWVIDESERRSGVFHCSIARLPEKRPQGSTTVRTIAFDPSYTFRPEMWPDVRNVSRPLEIPPGPRNPVGLCWIGLDRPGYGIHGTPNPELIGKTGSHGCFRLTNWDAQRLGRAVRVGTPVRFSGG